MQDIKAMREEARPQIDLREDGRGIVFEAY